MCLPCPKSGTFRLSMERTVECIPNFSEGRDTALIRSIAASIENGGRTNEHSEAGIKILGIEPGHATNRTVITFAGSPEAVFEAAFAGVRKAAELIDMRKHHGTHPRSGATDVLPFVPVSGITLEECAEMAKDLARRIYSELGIPCYCYEAAAMRPERKNLAVCRAGEYEALPEKISAAGTRPDFGPDTFNETVAKSGAVNIGARNFLIAVNFNLDTDSVQVARSIALDVREKGRNAMTPGRLKGCKAIGWYIEEYGVAQVSMNITDICATPLHRAFEEVAAAAQKRGFHVTGTEIIGLVPKRSILEAGTYFLGKRLMDADIPEREIIAAAIESMGLDELRPFVPEEKILEYAMGSLE